MATRSAEAAGMGARYASGVPRLARAVVKTEAGDFVVDEVGVDGVRASRAMLEASSSIEAEAQAECTLYVVRKENCEALAAQSVLSRVSRRSVSFAGLKDKVAISYQYATLSGGGGRRYSARGVTATPIAIAREPLRLGDLSGNAFVVVLRGVEGELGAVPTKMSFANYLGSQRTGSRDDESSAAWIAGRALLAGDDDAVLRAAFPTLESSTPKQVARKVRKTSQLVAAARTLAKTRDPKAAIAALPHRVTRLWLHAYQGRLFNLLLADALESRRVPDSLPLVGSETDLDAAPRLRHILDADRITLADFARLKCKGALRPALATADNFSVRPDRDSSSLRLSFDLPPGAYATAFLRELCDDLLLPSPVSSRDH